MENNEIAKNILNGTFKGNVKIICDNFIFGLAYFGVLAHMEIKRTDNKHYVRMKDASEHSQWKEIPVYLFEAFIKYQLRMKD